MSTKLKKYIVIDPEILGGSPVISGTRIPIERVYHLVRQGYTPATLKKEYPQVEIKKLQEIMSYLMEAGLDVFKEKYKIQASS